MKQIRTLEDLEQLIADRVEEAAQLEYKAAESVGRSDGKKREMTKDVSAMANAAGGTIVYGLAEARQNEGPPIPNRIDPVDAQNFSKEWLDQIIGQIRPRIRGLEIFPIQVDGDSRNCVYVVEIPQGSTAHQSLDYRYYARRNFEVTAMADYEIRDVMQRVVNPCVEAELRIVADYPLDSNSHIAIRLENTGEIMARHYAVVLRMPIKNKYGYIWPDDATIETSKGPAFFSVSFSNNGRTPLFPGSKVTFSKKFKHGGQIQLKEGGVIKETVDVAKVTLFADSMPKIEIVKDFDAAHKEWT